MDVPTCLKCTRHTDVARTTNCRYIEIIGGVFMNDL